MAANPILIQRLLKASGQNVNQMGRAALADSAPAPLLRLLGGNGNVNFTTQDSTPGAVARFSGKAAPQAYAGVNEDNPNTVQVMNEAAFRKPGQTGQLAVHEATHIMQNNLPPKVAAKIPADNPNDPYNFGGETGLVNMRKQGKTLLDLPREQQAAVMQYYTAQNDGYQNKVASGTATKADHDAAQQRQQVYGPWINDLNHVPQSIIMPTDPNAPGNTINTKVRPVPGPAIDIPGATMYAKQTYQYGDLPPGAVPADQQYSDLPPGAVPANDPNAPPPVVAKVPIPAELQGPPRPQGFMSGVAAGLGYTGVPTSLDELKRRLNTITMPNGQQVQNDNGKVSVLPAQASEPVNLDAAMAHPGYTAGQVLAPLAATLALGLAPKAMQGAGDFLQRSAVKNINDVVGARKADFKRGASPGEGYFQAGFGPSSSLSSIAEKAATAKQATGQQLGDTYAAHTASGALIPLEQGNAAIQTPISATRSKLTGPGGSTDTTQIDNYADTFAPQLKKAADAGGYTASQLFNIKKNVADNTSWGDPTQIGMKKLRQQNVGAISGVLADNVPGVSDLNSKYQNLSSLEGVSKYRADTGQQTLSGLAGKVASTTLASAVGAAAHHGLRGALFGAVPLVYDTVPVKTTVASAKYYGGGLLSKAGGALSSRASFPGIFEGKPDAVNGEVANNPQWNPNQENQPNAHGSLSSGPRNPMLPPPGISAIEGSRPSFRGGGTVVTPDMPTGLPGGTPKPPLVLEGKTPLQLPGRSSYGNPNSYPPLNEATSRMAVRPSQPNPTAPPARGVTVNPSGQAQLAPKGVLTGKIGKPLAEHSPGAQQLADIARRLFKKQ